jgi:hypothetical protein
MYEIVWLAVTQVRIFHAEEIPLTVLQVDSAAKALQSAFGFRAYSPIVPPATPDPMGGITFTHGELPIDGKVAGIQQLTIEPRRIVINVHASSKDANIVFARLVEILRELDPREKKPDYSPIVLTEETVSTIKLGFPLSRLFASEPLRGLGERLSEVVVGNGAKPKLTPSALHYHVSYSDLPPELVSQNVMLLPKAIRIEQRQQTDPNDHIYFITTPNPTDVHLVLVDHLSKLFGNPVASPADQKE